MKFYFLTENFFKDYKNCSEMERKANRPYANVCLIEYNRLLFAIPIRSHIKHSYAIFSNLERTKGLDLTKAVVIHHPQKYIDQETEVIIDRIEFEVLKSKEKIVEKKLASYVRLYKKAYFKQEVERNRRICSMSCLQYFHKELGIEEKRGDNMLEKLKENRTCRSFLQEEVKREDLEKIIEAISYCASARNAQNIRVLITNQEEDCKRIFPHTRWAGAIPWNPKEEEAPRAYILVALAAETAAPNDYVDMGIALQSMSLMARDLGYATCILGAYNKKEVAEIMGLQDDYSPQLLLALGKAKEEVEISLVSKIEKPYERVSETQHRVFKLEKSAYLLTSKHENK